MASLNRLYRLWEQCVVHVVFRKRQRTPQEGNRFIWIVSGASNGFDPYVRHFICLCTLQLPPAFVFFPIHKYVSRRWTIKKVRGWRPSINNRYGRWWCCWMHVTGVILMRGAGEVNAAALISNAMLIVYHLCRFNYALYKICSADRRISKSQPIPNWRASLTLTLNY